MDLAERTKRKNAIDRIANEESQKAVSDINVGLCYKCRCETAWQVAPVLVRRYGKIYFGYKCTECGTVVPEFAWGDYQRRGEIVIPDHIYSRKDLERSVLDEPRRS